jgi:hypothetical protein
MAATTIVDLRHGQKNVSVVLIALEMVGSVATHQREPVVTWLVADATGCIHMSAFAERGLAIRAGDVLRLEGG